MSLTDTQRAFLETFVVKAPLGAIGDNSDQTDTSVGDPMTIWRTAKESTDAGISSLQSALKTYGHPDLDNIAEMGLNGVTEGNQVALMRALMEFNGAVPDKKADTASKLLGQIDAYKAFIASDKTIDLCEKNPFGVSVAIKAPLEAALDKIAKVVSA